ncbi:hypothetical protein [Streptomyces platensis]|uniref:hypothetical protein n=1 Tax=Streptomyces platensis TaxID=58346 RepID=UPI00386AEEC0|nr:hypothetical protein OG962_30830 [Streptomyces platensis]
MLQRPLETTYTFFEQCQHRMACAKCDFYTPKNSTKSQILEAKGNLQRMPATIPLTDDERQLGIPADSTLLPLVEVRRSEPPSGSIKGRTHAECIGERGNRDA